MQHNSNTCRIKRSFQARPMLRKTVATHRLKELRHLRAVEKLTAWRRNNGFDQCDDVRNKQWVHSTLPPTPEQTTTSMWAEVNTLQKAISMSEKERSKQRVESFISKLEQGTASLTDEEFPRLERMIRERSGRVAAHMVVAPINTAPVTPDRVQKYRLMYVFIWTETTRAGWTRSERSSNHHRMVWVLKHPDSSVSRTGRWDESLSTTVYSSAGLRIRGETRFPSQISSSGREPIAKLQHRLPHQKSLSCK